MGDIAQPKRLVAAYAGAPAGQQYEMWREELCRGFCRMDVEPSQHDRIDCRTVYTTISSVTLARPTGVSGRSCEHGRSSQTDTMTFYCFSPSEDPYKLRKDSRLLTCRKGRCASRQ